MQKITDLIMALVSKSLKQLEAWIRLLSSGAGEKTHLIFSFQVAQAPFSILFSESLKVYKVYWHRVI